MYFTQDDYKKIDSWLKLNSIRDSDMPSTTTLQEEDTLVLTQKNGTKFQNNKIKASDFLSQIWKYIILLKNIISTSMIKNQAVTPNKLSQEVYELLGNNITIKDPNLYDVKIYIDSEGNIYAESSINMIYIDEGDIYVESIN